MQFSGRNWLYVVSAGMVFALFLACAGPVVAQTNQPDLTGVEITLKTKGGKNGTQINNAKVVVENIGSADAKNSSIEYYLSADTTLTTDTASADADTLIHRQSLGMVKAGKEKSRTIGGGLINRHETTGMYIIALIDSANQLAESDENNNVLVSDPLP